MPRRRSPDRLDTIVAAALATFAAAGYRRTRMADIAAAAGVSPGLLYSYAESKEALFGLVIQRELGVDLATLPLPAPGGTEADLLDALRASIRIAGEQHAIAAAERVETPVDIRAECAGIVAEEFDGIAGARTLLRVVERCAADWPALAATFYEQVRQPHVERLAAYLARRRDAGLLPIGDADVAARFVIETIAWFANHRFNDHDGASLDDDTVRTEVVDLITRALVES